MGDNGGEKKETQSSTRKRMKESNDGKERWRDGEARRDEKKPEGKREW